MSGPTAPLRVAGIDAIRGLCVLLVVLHHIHLRFLFNRFDVGTLLPAVVGRVVFWSGYLAVVMFFVMSGFLITSLSLSRWPALNHMDVRWFYRLRVARIAPCLLLLVALLSVLHLAGATGFVINQERTSLGRAVVAALTFHVNWLEARHGYLPGAWDVLWSLSVEEVFYLLFPPICLLLGRSRWALLPLVILIVVGPPNRVRLAGQEPWSDTAYLSCMDGIAFGVLAAVWARGWRQPSRRALYLLAGAGALAALWIVVIRWPSTMPVHRLGLGVTILEAGVAAMLVALAHGVGGVVLTRRAGLLLAVGRSSYEIYLTHMLVLLACMPLIVRWQPGRAGIAACYGVLLVLAVVFGSVVRRVYSEPLNRRLRGAKPGLVVDVVHQPAGV